MEISKNRQEQEIIANLLKQITKGKEEPTVSIQLSKGKESLALPAKTTALLLKLLSFIAKGQSVTLLASEEELTTSEAAKLLKVSRPFLVKLLKEKQIPFRKVGSHRRILIKDILAYRKKMEVTTAENLAFLTQQAQELNLGY